MVLMKGRSGAGPCQSVQSSVGGGAIRAPRPIEGRRLVYHDRAKCTSPITPSCTARTAACTHGQLRRWMPCCTTTPCFRAAATASSPSSGVWLHGFST